LSEFGELLASLLDEYFALHPHVATAVGDHRFDGAWPDLSEDGRLDRVAFADRWTTALGEVPDRTLDADDRLDRDLLVGELDALRFGETELRQEAWDALETVYLIGFGLFPLTAREFAPLAARLTSFAERLEGVPRLLEASRAALGSVADRPVSRLHTDTAIKRFAGIVELARDAVAQAEAAADDDQKVAPLVPRLAAATAATDAAVIDHVRHLEEAVLPAATGDGLLGDDLFEAKLRHTLRDEAATTTALLARAEAEYAAVRAEMVRIATRLWPEWRSGEPQPSDERALVRGVLDAIAADHPRAEELVDFCRAELERIEDFCRAKDLIGLADEPLEIRWTPEFLRNYAGAMLDAPGPLDKGQKTFFAITPPRDEWGPEEVESHLREENSRQLRLLTIHEAVPGHYLQGVYANRCASLARAVFASGLFAEGWAVYVTQVMMDAGFAADDEALWLVHWKFYLRSVVNAIIDVRIHTAGMTTAEAVGLMVDGAFQEEAEATSKDERARLSSTQLSTYFVGSLGMWDLELETREHAAEQAGAGRDAIPPPRVVGGYGETPGFRLRDHLESVISHGTIPIPLVRRRLAEERAL